MYFRNSVTRVSGGQLDGCYALSGNLWTFVLYDFLFPFEWRIKFSLSVHFSSLCFVLLLFETHVYGGWHFLNLICSNYVPAANQRGSYCIYILLGCRKCSAAASLPCFSDETRSFILIKWSIEVWSKNNIVTTEDVQVQTFELDSGVSEEEKLCLLWTLLTSAGQIIKRVCVCRLWAHYHDRISWSILTKIDTVVRTPKSKNEFIGVNIPFCPQLLF